MSASLNAQNVVVVTGDDGQNRLRVVDGRNSGGDNYGVQLIDEDGGTVAGDASCVQVGPSTFCGDSTVRQVQVVLAGGTDEVIGGGSSFSQLQALSADLGAGDDKTSGQWIGLPVTFNGGDGDDRLFGDVSQDTIDGGPGNDQILGATGNDTIHGGDGDDQLNGGGNDDRVYGEAGNDSLDGSGDSDTLDGGSGTDTVDGDGGVITEGNDVINVADGERDTVSCGPGGDTVTADSLDVIGSDECESVTRGSGSGRGFSVGGVSASKKTGVLTVIVKVPSAGRLAFLVTAKVPAGLLALQRKITVVKRSGSVPTGGTYRAKLKPRRAAMKVLRQKGRLKALLKVSYTPTGGTKSTKKRAVTFRLAR
jgi:Ca2+-binding RTX toxin-like protein